jgi:hypothetical protein
VILTRLQWAVRAARRALVFIVGDATGSPWADVSVAPFCQRWQANLASARALANGRLGATDDRAL